MNNDENLNFVFFGTDDFSIAVLDELAKDDLLPSLIVTSPDRPKGRGLELTSPPIKLWAETRKIPILQPETLDSSFNYKLVTSGYQLFIVASYGKILPKFILDIPKDGCLNIHPSLLPKYRGASPIESQILNDEKEVGVSVILLDEKMDHGPILGEKRLIAGAMPMPANVLSRLLATLGGRLLAEILSKYLSGEITPAPQEEELATFTKKIKKEDGEITLDGDAYKNYLKYLAFIVWPGTYFFAERKGVKVRVKITDAIFTDDKFVIKKVIPESGKEMNYEDFLRG